MQDSHLGSNEVLAEDFSKTHGRWQSFCKPMTFQHKRKYHDEGPVKYKRHKKNWGNMVRIKGLRHNKGIGDRDINVWSAKIKDVYGNTHFVI